MAFENTPKDGTYYRALSTEKNKSGKSPAQVSGLAKQAVNIPKQYVKQEIKSTDAGRGYTSAKDVMMLATAPAVVGAMALSSKTEKTDLNKILNKNVVEELKDVNKVLSANGLDTINTKALGKDLERQASGLLREAEGTEAYKHVSDSLERAKHLGRESRSVDVKAEIDSINKILRKNGLNTINSKARGRELQRQARVLLKQAQNRQASPEALDCIKRARLIGKNTKYAKKRYVRGKLKKIRRNASGFLRRNSGNDEAREGFRMVVNPASKKAFKAGLKTARYATRMSRFIAKKTMLGALKLAVIATPAPIKVALKPVGEATKKVATAPARGVKKIKRAAKRTKNNIKNRIKDTLKNLLKKSRNRIMRNKYGRFLMNKGSALNRAASKVFRFVGTPFRFFTRLARRLISSIKSILATLGGILLLVVVIIVLIQLIATMIGGVLGWSGGAERTEKIVKELNKLYTTDLENMLALNKNYYTLTIDYEDVKDVDEYEKNKTEMVDSSKWKGFSQSTNCAEIMSMANVKFGNDIDSDEWETDEILDYVRGIYYGTHDIIITEYDELDEEGNSRKSATVTYRTYYFKDAFSCIEKDVSEYKMITKGSASMLVCSVDDIYVFFRNNKYSHEAACAIIGNMAKESGGNSIDGINPKLNSETCIGICSWSMVDSPGRVKALKEKANLMNDDYLSMNVQLEYLIDELDGPYVSVRDKIKDSNDIDYCVRVFEEGFERAGTPDMPTRIKCAHDANERYKAYKKDWSKLINNGKKLAQYAASFAEKIHYTQGESRGYIGSRYIGPNLSSITTDKVKRTKGTDCSGFIASVFQHYGLSAPTTTAGYSSLNSVVKIKDIQPGDVLWTSGHVEMYIGDGKTMGLHDQVCVNKGTKKCNEDSNININGLEYFKKFSDCKVYRLWK